MGRLMTSRETSFGSTSSNDNLNPGVSDSPARPKPWLLGSSDAVWHSFRVPSGRTRQERTVCPRFTSADADFGKAALTAAESGATDQTMRLSINALCSRVSTRLPVRGASGLGGSSNFTGISMRVPPGFPSNRLGFICMREARITAA